ncbi:MAG: carboxylating nicotinate-nucleotide diphosphorylase [Phycisphaerales bacterium]
MPQHAADISDLSPAAFYERLASTGLVRRLLELARDEDLGPGRVDITAAVMLDPGARTTARLVAREPGVLAGLALLDELLDAFGVSGEIDATPHAADADPIASGDSLLTLQGSSRAIVTIERTLLNLVGRLSGVASRTAEFASRIPPGSRAKLCDTRKTTPGLRVLEKYAVRCGGGSTHRLGLHDAVLVKDNHVAAIPLDELAKRLTDAARRAWELRIDMGDADPAPPAFVEVEVDSPAQLERVLSIEEGLIDFVLLDNFTTEQMRAAVALRDRLRSSVQLEASGGVTLDSVADVAATGVDRISVGSLTHHAVSLDVGLDIEPAGA